MPTLLTEWRNRSWQTLCSCAYWWRMPGRFSADDLLSSLPQLRDVAMSIAADESASSKDRLAAVDTALRVLALMARAAGMEGASGWEAAERAHALEVARQRAASRRACLDDVERRSGMRLDDWQRELALGDVSTLVLCGRQVGKTTAAAAAAVVEMMADDRAHVVCVSPSLRQSQELYTRIARLVDVVCGDQVASSNAISVRLKSGAKCVSLPASEHTIRGLSAVTLLLEDEASRVPDELYAAVRPMLATTRGRHVMMSTPWGPRGHFYDEWRSGVGWAKITVRSSECSRITKEFLETEKQRLGARWYAQEYDCEFVAAEDALFGDVLSRVVYGGMQHGGDEAWVA
jgi:hypothetical protein